MIDARSLDKPQTGLTLPELLTTLAIVSLLAVIAMPGFSESVRRNRVSAESSHLLGVLIAARSEAIRRGARVALCRSSDGITCNAAAGHDWQQGIVVFVDENANQNLEPDEAVVRTGMPFSKADLVSFSGRGALSYRSNGAVVSGGTFTIRSGDHEKKVIVSLAGHSRIE